MRVLSLEIQDILSIQQASLKFEDTGLVLVEGWNYDTQRANGAGKTAIFNGLSFALYDKLPRKITASEILRRGCKTGFAEASVLCGEDIWTVRRSRPKGAIFSKNGIPQDITQAEFESFIRLSYGQFLLTIYTPQSNSGELIRFLSSPDAAKKEFLLQLLNLDQFGSGKKLIDDLIKKFSAAVEVDDRSLASTRSRIQAYEESLVDTASLQTKINQYILMIADLEKEILEQAQVTKPDLSKYISVEDKIRTQQSEIAQAKAKRGMLHDRYRELRSAIGDYNSDAACGECGASLDTAEARLAHADHQKKVQDKAASVKTQIDETDAIVLKEQGVTDLARRLREKKQQDSADYQAAQLRLSELKASVRTQNLQVENLSLKLNSNADLQNKIETLEASVSKLVTNISANKRQLEVYKTLSNIYSPTGAQAYVLDSIVDSFNEIIQKYVDILSPTMTYVLNSFKENGKGEISAKFSETLMKNGKDVSVGSLSGGEQKGLSLCVDFALLEVLETQFGMTLNPIILDEPFDGLDEAGREIVIDLLETLARTRQIFVIDHAAEAKAKFTKSFKVELRNEISVINLEF
jgi:DNA repair exonuclease SbcCD ATPase subunit